MAIVRMIVPAGTLPDDIQVSPLNDLSRKVLIKRNQLARVMKGNKSKIESFSPRPGMLFFWEHPDKYTHVPDTTDVVWTPMTFEEALEWLDKHGERVGTTPVYAEAEHERAV